ncbi:glycosyltransferase family 2 protein [Pseudochrobactrum sp. HB0163]|uniref:glycosyltransferase family 2 protein n=1 Tax=Pseudochrobactrum sp. HB0163 TaxID=3450708 RepID=UPI003F6E284E
MAHFHVLQNIILPDETRADRTVLFARWPQGNVSLADQDGALSLKQGTMIDLMSFFNAFSHRKWHALTGIKQLGFRISGCGRVRIIISAYHETAAARAVVEYEGDLSEEGLTLDIGDISKIHGEVLAADILAISDAKLKSAYWATLVPPLRKVTLAAVITSFRREREVQAAIKKFTDVIIPHAPKGHLHLYVIDNGKTLAETSGNNVTVLHNENFGGAGGFSRGFIEAQKSGGFSHVLFMDDDASCEPESVWRTQALLGYVKDERGSVAGAMLYADRPTIQYEKGASVRLHGKKDSIWKAHHHGWDLADIASVAANDLTEKANYGGWWFFAFPVKAVDCLAFPFFVRGDDVDFSITNKLNIITLNGVATWCDNFGYKLNPPTEYLAARSWMALCFMHSDSDTIKDCFRLMSKYAIKLGMRFDYAGMHAVLDGLEHAFEGPDFFNRHPAPLDILAIQKNRHSAEKLELQQFEKLRAVSWRKPRIRRLLAFLSFGGALLPTNLTRPVIIHTRIAWEAGSWTLLRVSAAAFGAGRDVRLYRRNAAEFRQGLMRIARLKLRFIKQFKQIQKEYDKKKGQYRSPAYWCTILGLSKEDEL